MFYSSQRKSPLDLEEEELNENLTVLQVQLSTAGEEVNNLRQQDKQFSSVCSIRAGIYVYSLPRRWAHENHLQK